MTETVTERIDRILSENPIGLSAAAKLFGTFRGGKPTSPATLFRWCIHGVKLPDGRRVHLEHIRIGNRLMTSRPACLRFLESQQPDPASAVPVRTPTQRNRAADRAARELEAMGA